MHTFVYKARDPRGALLSGAVEGESEQLVAGKLRAMGYLPVSIERRGAGLRREISIPGLSNRIALKDVAVLSRQFATMVNAGLSLPRSLTILAEQTENKELAGVIAEVRDDVEEGASLSAAMTRHPKAFNRLFVSMVRAGEVGGMLDDVLLRLADTIEGQVGLRRKVKSAMSYPLMVSGLIFIIMAAMLVFIVPTFEDMYSDVGGDLPLPTKILLDASAVFTKLWYLIVLLGGGSAVAFRRWIRTDAGSARWDAVKLRLPVFGVLVHKTTLARFSRSLAALLRAGVPILTALEIVATTSGSATVAAAMEDAQIAVKGGDPLSRPLSEHPVFPPMVVQMMAVGEETGAVDELLERIAHFYEGEVEATVDGLTAMIEPLLIVVMGVTVGAMVVALYLPMFNIVNVLE